MQPCIQLLTIGTIANLSTAVYVYLVDKSSGLMVRVGATSTGAGLVVADLSEIELSPTHLYELFITLENAWIGDKLDITVGAATTDCITLDIENLNEPRANQTIAFYA